jgi:Mce-associated membrane protein
MSAVLALGGLAGWLGYRAHEADKAEQVRAQLISAARQAAVNLTTIDHEQADADVQRILDSATGEFYEDFKARSGPFIEVVKKVRSVSVGTVTEAGLESASGREGQVLVAVTVLTRTAETPETQPRYWRMRLSVTEQDGTAKVRRVDFVP